MYVLSPRHCGYRKYALMIEDDLKNTLFALYSAGVTIQGTLEGDHLVKVITNPPGRIRLIANKEDTKDIAQKAMKGLDNQNAVIQIGLAAPEIPLVAFSMPLQLPTFNPMLRMHWSKKRKIIQALSWEVVAALPRNERPPTPLKNVNVMITRYGKTEPDEDNLKASSKLLLDVLQPMHPTVRPYGLGVILNDAKWCVHSTTVVHVCSNEKRTDVKIFGAAPDVGLR